MAVTPPLDEPVRAAASSFWMLDPDQIVATVERLTQRIEAVFPSSGLGRVGSHLLRIAQRAKDRSAWIARPIVALRLGAWVLVAVIVAGIGVTIVRLRPPAAGFEFGQFIQVLESGINDVVLVGAAIFFLVTFETRIKRRRALTALHELRVVAHIIDMHQLTKDPDITRDDPAREATGRRMTAAELARYLDFCSEMLSLTGKVAALYVQGFDDSVALQAVNEIEALTTGLAGKIWQKLVVLQEQEGRSGSAA